MRACHSCGAELDDRMEVFRSSVCPSCGKDLRICLNCVFYNPGAHWDCRENIPEAVRDKDRANFCDYFRFKKGPSAGQEQPKGSKKANARDAFDRLFDGQG
jgi:hypothetical protein